MDRKPISGMVDKLNEFKSTADLFKEDRKSVKIVIGLLAGYCKFKKHMSKIGLVAESIYRFCRTLRNTVSYATAV